MDEFAHGHGMRRCRYRGQPKTHLRHVLTAIAANEDCHFCGLRPVAVGVQTSSAQRDAQGDMCGR
ncbi:hypothetical protein ACWC3X_10225 [Streptomyces populi]